MRRERIRTISKNSDKSLGKSEEFEDVCQELIYVMDPGI